MSKRCHKRNLNVTFSVVSSVLLKASCQLTDSRNKNIIDIFKNNMEFAEIFSFSVRFYKLMKIQVTFSRCSKNIDST